jgi:hypothetical protein
LNPFVWGVVEMDDYEVEELMLVALVIVLIQAIFQTLPSFEDDEFLLNYALETVDDRARSAVSQFTVSSSALFDFRLCCNTLLQEDDELRYWVKPRSMVWFMDFLMQQYDNSRWIAHFRMHKDTVLDLCRQLKPYVGKEDTRYHPAVPIHIRVCCALYKFAHGCTILECSEKFAIGRSTVGSIIRDFVWAISHVFKRLISWPVGDKMCRVMLDFQNLCDLPSCHGAIDGMHVAIAKPSCTYPEDYYYHKSGGFSIIAQVVVDS